MTVTNNKNIPLPFAVFLATDNYDMVPAVNKISVTTLLKSTRRVILGQRSSGGSTSWDVSEKVSSAVGSAIHAGLESAWQKPHAVLKELGFPAAMVDRLVMNPTEVTEGGIYGYTELRTEKPFCGFIISGSCDFILDGTVYDYKTIGMFKYNKGDWQDFLMQISIYRWLNQDKITQPEGRIELYIRDWEALKASYNKSYPQNPFIELRLPLISVSDTERYMRNKLNLLVQYADTPEPELPLCTPAELWQDAPKWQYVSPGGAKKNFDSEPLARAYMAQKGYGTINLKPAQAKACKYCSERLKCSQATQLEQAGLLDLS